MAQSYTEDSDKKCTKSMSLFGCRKYPLICMAIGTGLGAIK